MASGTQLETDAVDKRMSVRFSTMYANSPSLHVGEKAIQKHAEEVLSAINPIALMDPIVNPPVHHGDVIGQNDTMVDERRAICADAHT